MKDTLTFEPIPLSLPVHTTIDTPPPPCIVLPSTTLDALSAARTTTTRRSRRPGLQPEDQKAVKRGYKSFHEPRVCGISFEGLPAWLWTLRTAEWSSILLTEPDKRRICKAHPLLYSQYGDKFRVIMQPLDSDPAVFEAVVWWVSGSQAFVESLMLPVGVPAVAWVMGCSRRSPPPSTPGSQWLSVSHAKVGGCTTSRGKFFVYGLAEMIEIPHDLTRNIGHIIKYSVRSKPCPPTLDIPHYWLSSKLSTHQLAKPVLVPSNFSATGWGCRLLEPSELALAFELPAYLAWDSIFATQLIPLQILRCVMDAVIDMQRPAVQPRGGQRSCRRSLPPALADPPMDREWLPTPPAMALRIMGVRPHC